jgi:hypothetical protein
MRRKDRSEESEQQQNDGIEKKYSPIVNKFYSEFHLLLKLEHLRSHSVDPKIVLSDPNRIKLELLQVSLDVGIKPHL